MQMSISKKLIVSFLGLTVVILIATLGLARWSFERGFSDYVYALEQKRLEGLAEALGQGFVGVDRNWSNFSRQDFRNTLRAEGRVERRGHLDRNRKYKSGPPTGLYDNLGNIIAGKAITNLDADTISIFIKVDGEKVGELRSLAPRHFVSTQESAFSRQQFRSSLLIGMFSLILALAVSWLISLILLSPIRKMMTSVAHLSRGDYRQRLTGKRKDELGELARNINQLAQKLEKSRASRKQWLADISHELRTPIAVLTLELEAIKDGIREFDHQQLISFDQELGRLRHLIDDLYQLSLSDIGGLRYNFSAVAIRPLIATVITSAHARAAEKEIAIKVEGGLNRLVKGDEQRLDQLFSNLISNSIAYTEHSGFIHIRITQQSSEILVITVEDSPASVSEEDCKKLFDPLYRADPSRKRDNGGAGLGLAIAKNIVEAHNGKITASPSTNPLLGGLCVEISLPVMKDAR